MSDRRKESVRGLGLTKSESQTYYERALTQFGRGNYEEAVVDVSEALHYDPNRAELYAARGFFYVQWAQEKKLADKLEDAIVDLNYAIKLNKRQWFAHLVLGMVDFSNGQWSDAFKHFNDAKEASPGRPEPWFYRAICHYKLGKPLQAEEEMQTALRWMPEGDKRRAEANRWLKEFASAVQASS